MKSIFEQNGGTYYATGDYQLPCLSVTEQPENSVGIWGSRRMDYLKKHRPILYVNLLTSGKLFEYLQKINATACERKEVIIDQMMEVQGVTEQLKVENQMLWVGKANNIRACADEIVLKELINS